MKPTYTTIWKYARLLLAIAPFVVIFRRSDLSQLVPVLSAIQWWTIPVAACVFLASVGLQVLRWWLLMRPHMPELTYREALVSHASGMFHSVIFPSSFAQEIIRAIALSRKRDPMVVWSSSWMGKLLSLASWLSLSLVGIAMLGVPSVVRRTDVSLSLLAVLLLIAILVAASFSKRTSRVFRPLLLRLIPARILGTVENLRQAVYSFRSQKRQVVSVGLITLVLQFILVYGMVLVVAGVTGHMHFLLFLAYIPIVELMVIAIPLTPNGIGLREALLAAMFTQAGIGKEQIAAYMVVNIFMLVVQTLVSGVVAFGGKKLLRIGSIS